MSARRSLWVGAWSGVLLAAVAVAGPKAHPPAGKHPPPTKSARQAPAVEPSADAGVVAAPPQAPVPDAPKATTVTAVPVSAMKGLHGGETRCGACHSSASWTDVKFNHDRTGFPLKAAHSHTSCKSCHVSTFETPLPTTCVGCHQDPHAGDVGGQCAACHEETNWHSSVGLEAHRRSGFPLTGSHASVPCLECHSDAREKRFTRPAVKCTACHEADRAATVGGPLDHQRLGFTGPCLDCHGPMRFSPAKFAAHDRCFPISSGAHSALGCTECHSGFPATATAQGKCSTGTETCTGCHEHQCSGKGGTLPTDQRHATIEGYRCQSEKCWGCHKP